MEVDRIPHMGGALRDEAPLWQKPGNGRRHQQPESEPEDEFALHQDEAQEEPSPEQDKDGPHDGTLDVVA